MECKFVVGQRVVRKPGIAYKIDPEYETAVNRPIIREGDVFTIAYIVPCRDSRIGLEFAEVPCFIQQSGVKVYWDHADFAPLHDLGFWVGEEAAKKLQQTRGKKVPQPTNHT
jgi:hypothetical protein